VITARQNAEDLVKTLATTLALAMLSPALVWGMTVECRDLTLGQWSEQLTVALGQRRAVVSPQTGLLLGRYSFEILRQTPDIIVLLGQQSAMPWPSPVLVLGIDLEGTKTWAQLGGLFQGDRIAGAIEWVCRRTE
jgi:hypothetical protein